MNEPYRTLLGHLRHEAGHHYWERLIRAAERPIRALFGDERLTIPRRSKPLQQRPARRLAKLFR